MTAMMTVTGQMTLMKFWMQVLDVFSTEIPLYLENGTR